VIAPTFIGDEVTASAWRLTGARATAVESGMVQEAFEAALANDGLLLITTACAAELNSERLDAAMRQARPLVLVVPDAADRIAPPELDSEVERVLGIEQ
jgi:vacuolar-type H+-ATPase subunit F/Vma7